MFVCIHTEITSDAANLRDIDIKKVSCQIHSRFPFFSQLRGNAAGGGMNYNGPSSSIGFFHVLAHEFFR